ncbi:MAG: methionyl-tRNA formyltransferase [Candidatus Omnitrophica bacterium]|nr:methionyl-tRNA formyltransferase [Candidatus Omnitrophota bacterium]
MKSKTRILFIGGTKRGYLTLKALLESGANVVGIISLVQDKHEFERYEDSIRDLAGRFNVPHQQTRRIQDREYEELIAERLKPDVAIVVGCRFLIPKSIYSLPPLGTIAIHDSFLPKYRGFAPLNWAILNGEKQTGVTAFFIAEGMDTGDIVSQRTVPIGPDDTAPAVHERVCQETVTLVLEICSSLDRGSIPRLPQKHDQATYTCSRHPEDGLIDWERDTACIYNRIRALAYPYPGAFTYYQGRKLTVWSAATVRNPSVFTGRIPGKVVDISKSEGYADVLTGDGVLRVFEVQREDGPRQPASEVLNSVRDQLGLKISDLLQRIDLLEKALAKVPDVQYFESKK